MGVQLTSFVGSVETNSGLIEKTSDLNVPRRFYKLNGSKSSGGDNASAMPRFGAVGDNNGFDVTNLAIWRWRTPKTEIRDVVNKHGLAL
jgi:hypothetical protein